MTPLRHAPTGTVPGPPALPGYTLVELMLAVVIVGILVGLAAPEYREFQRSARVSGAKTEIRTLETEIAAYHAENQVYPSSLADVGRDGVKDPWGNPYQYLRIEGAKTGGGGGGGGDSLMSKVRKDRFLVPLNSDYDLYSMGPDGRSEPPLTAAQSWDDIIRASDGAFVGKASDY